MSSEQPFTETTNVVRLTPARKTIRRITGVVVVVALVSLAAAAGMRSDVPDGRADTAHPAAADPAASIEFVYFPAQFVNQATDPSEHIQAF